MSERFIDSESVPFIYDSKSNKLWRMEGDKRIPVPMTKSSAAITLRGMPISEERAKELADTMLE